MLPEFSIIQFHTGPFFLCWPVSASFIFSAVGKFPPRFTLIFVPENLNLFSNHTQSFSESEKGADLGH